jgi:hypothetical protein
MLCFMQEFTADQSLQAPQTSQDFAGLLAALATAKQTGLPSWSDEELHPDVTTLSYESALRTHARYKVEEEVGPAQVGQREPARSRVTRPVTLTSQRERKCASVTLRMSEAECEQLRKRAAEARLTVSAYLRLCAFEAESLRAQVKEALAELRGPHAHETRLAVEAGTQPAIAENNGFSRGSRLGWLRRMMPDLHPPRA